jgi:hypothetical protein
MDNRFILRDRLATCLRSRPLQVAGVLAAFLFIGALHWPNDGLWFQGDSPRHAMNGLFYWDLVRTLPVNVLEFAVSYYARYPVINPATYPPLFYVLEGATFAAVGPLPHAGKFIVLSFAVLAGLYTMAWCRRWLGAAFGWAGAFLAVLPGVVLWSNSVMLNMPSAALGMACLYHFRRWLETEDRRQLLLTSTFAIAVLLTYYPGISVLIICAGWMVFRWRGRRFNRRLFWLATGAACSVAPLLMALLLAPIHTSRHVPTMSAFLSPSTWTFYWNGLPNIIGSFALVAGIVGIAASACHRRLKTEAAFVGIWILALIVGLSVVPAKNPRYILLAAPAFVIASALGIKAIASYLRAWHAEWQAAALAGALAGCFWGATTVYVPNVSGFREIAAYLRESAPDDAVLYDGMHDGLFGFYVRASDPDFQRRMVRADRFLYEYGPGRTFEWVEKSNVTTTSEVLTLLRTRSGCRWVAIEVGPTSSPVRGRQLLRLAVTGPEFEFVRSFPITGARTRRVDLYRLTADVDPVEAVDLNFPSLSDRTFRHAIPITR